MAHVVETRITTPYAELRTLLDRAERELPSLETSSLVDYLLRLDRIEALLAQLQQEEAQQAPASGLTLQPELVRWADLQDQLKRRSARIVKLAAPLGGFPALRAQHLPAEGMWWWLDEYVAARRRQQTRRLLQTLALVGVLLLAAAWAYRTWFAPSPETIALVDALSTIERHVDAREWEAALAAAEEGLQTMPDSPELLTWAAVICEQLGNEPCATQYRARALAQFAGQEIQFQLLLGNNRFRAGDLDGAEAAANAALALRPDEPQAFFLLGNIAEARGDFFTALEAFDRAATLAEASDPQLTVISKMRYGFLLQQIQANPGFDSAPTSPQDSAESTQPANP